MDDLIYRQEAIRIASGYCHPANIAKELAKLPSAQPETRCVAEVKIDGEELQECVDKAVRQIAENMPAQRWIPVSEKMPEKGGYYLVTCGDDVRSQEVDCYDHGNNRFVFYNVIAWMPMPEPYEGGNDA